MLFLNFMKIGLFPINNDKIANKILKSSIFQIYFIKNLINNFK